MLETIKDIALIVVGSVFAITVLFIPCMQEVDIILRLLFAGVFSMLIIEGGANIYDRIKDLMEEQELEESKQD